MAISEENFGTMFAANDSFKLTISRYRKWADKTDSYGEY